MSLNVSAAVPVIGSSVLFRKAMGGIVSRLADDVDGQCIDVCRQDLELDAVSGSTAMNIAVNIINTADLSGLHQKGSVVVVPGRVEHLLWLSFHRGFPAVFLINTRKVG